MSGKGLKDKLQHGEKLRVLFINDLGFLQEAGRAHLRQMASFLLMGHEVMGICWTNHSRLYNMALQADDIQDLVKTYTDNNAETLYVNPFDAGGVWRGWHPLPHAHIKHDADGGQMIQAILQEVETYQPEVIIVGNLHASRWPLALFPALRARVTPVIAYMHDCYLLTGRCIYPGNCPLYLAGCDARCPTASYYPVLAPERIAGAWQLRQDIFAGPEGIAMATNSRWLLDRLQQTFPEPFYADVLYPGLDTRLFQPIDRVLARRLLGLPEDRFIILSNVTNWEDAYQGGYVLRQVIAALAGEADFLVSGPESSGMHNVHLTGLVQDYRKMPLLYSAADLFVSTALDDAFAHTLCEAAACALPAVAFRVGGVPEVARHDLNARLANHGSIEGLLTEIRYLMQAPDVRLAFGQAGRAMVEAEFSLQRQGERWMAYLHHLPITTTTLDRGDLDRQESVHWPSWRGDQIYVDVHPQRTVAQLNDRLDSHAQKASKYPKISLVTTSLNQVDFLEKTIQSVLGQGYPNLEYIIIDGGSTDGSVKLIEHYASQLAYWVSEPDYGHPHALNKGFAQTRGEIMGWLNSDDLLLPGALYLLASIFTEYDEIEWLTGQPAFTDVSGRIIGVFPPPRWSRAKFLAGDYRWLQQESTYWRRSLWDRAGGYIVEHYPMAFDFELWVRFFRYARLYCTYGLVGAFRFQPGQKTQNKMDIYEQEASEIINHECAMVAPANGPDGDDSPMPLYLDFSSRCLVNPNKIPVLARQVV